MRLHSIQYLRAIAALMVVVFHLHLQFNRAGYNGPWPDFLAAGVDVFFVVSGFIMWSTTQADSVSPLEFMRRRLARIVPLYWIVNLIFLAMLLALPTALQSAKFDAPHIVSSFLFLPFPHPVLGTLEPLVVAGWTLNYEMFFYAIFAMCLFAPASVRIYIVGATLGVLALAGELFAFKNPYLEFYTSSIIVEFLLGIVIAEACIDKVFLPARLLKQAIAVSIGLVILLPALFPNLPRLYSWGIPAAAAVYAIVSAEARKPIARLYWLGLLGDASYSLYLTHGVALSAAGQLWRRLSPDPSALGYGAFAIAAMASAVTLAVLCYRFIELPADRLLRRRRSEVMGAFPLQGMRNPQHNWRSA